MLDNCDSGFCNVILALTIGWLIHWTRILTMSGGDRL